MDVTRHSQLLRAGRLSLSDALGIGKTCLWCGERICETELAVLYQARAEGEQFGYHDACFYALCAGVHAEHERPDVPVCDVASDSYMVWLSGGMPLLRPGIIRRVRARQRAGETGA